jgi:hypothetical protein
MIRGRAGTMTPDYRRDGTTDLFAALQEWSSPRAANSTPPPTSWRSSRPSTGPSPAGRTSTSCWTTCQPTRHRSGDPRLVRSPTTSPPAPALDPHLEHMAQPCAATVQGTHRSAAAPGHLHQRARPHRSRPDVGQVPQPGPKAIHLPRRSRRNPRESPPRTKNPLTSQINHAAPGDGRVGGASTQIRCANRA